MSWRDGTTALLFEPLEFLEKLAAITPRPAINLLVYHGVLAPHAPARRQVVGYGRPARETPVPFPAGSGADPAGAEVPRPPRHWAWAALLHRAFALDALACDRCGGRLRLLATLSDPDVIRQLLAHRDRRRAAEPLAPGPAPPASPDPAVGR